MQARFIEETGTLAFLRVYWDEYKPGIPPGSLPTKACPRSFGSDYPGSHGVMVLLAQTDKREDWDLGGKVEDHADPAWPPACSSCGAPVPPAPAWGYARTPPESGGLFINRQVFHKIRFNTPSLQPEPGDMFWQDDHSFKRSGGEHCLYGWSNCDGRHLVALVPTGEEWHVDSRASNCDKPDEKTHRCWVRHGEPPMVTAGKQGNTCGAGAGSIQTRKWHGYLQDGVWAVC